MVCVMGVDLGDAWSPEGYGRSWSATTAGVIVPAGDGVACGES